jgi:hypothetical protein
MSENNLVNEPSTTTIIDEPDTVPAQAPAYEEDNVQAPVPQENDVWTQLRVSPDRFEINEVTHQIRDVMTGRVCRLRLDNHTGYLQLSLNGRTWFYHRVLAYQYLGNPEDSMASVIAREGEPFKYQNQRSERIVVDHIDRNKLNNDIGNLRWATLSLNNKNKSGHGQLTFIWLDNLPDGWIQINTYMGYHFNDLYYTPNDGHFYKKVENKYRMLVVGNRNRSPRVRIQERNGVDVSIYIRKFRQNFHL